MAFVHFKMAEEARAFYWRYQEEVLDENQPSLIVVASVSSDGEREVDYGPNLFSTTAVPPTRPPRPATPPPAQAQAPSPVTSLPPPQPLPTTTAETGLSQEEIDILLIEADILNAEAEWCRNLAAVYNSQAKIKRLHVSLIGKKLSLKRRRLNP